MTVVRRGFPTLMTLLVCGTLSCGHTDATAAAPGSTWSSDDAVLSVTETGAELRLLASGGCVGSYVSVTGPFLGLSINRTGTFTQLIGAYPGRVTYAAQVSGSFRDTVMRLTVTVPELARVIGPLDLVRGVRHDWPTCAYP
ncbi:MAG: hypothetical protein U0163_06105 [Gemmatimonadaceae bacterium]